MYNIQLLIYDKCANAFELLCYWAFKDSECRNAHVRSDIIENKETTLSHFSYAPLLQGPHFFDKNAGIEYSFINSLIDILSVWWHRKIFWNHSCESFCYVKGKNARATWTFIFSFAFCTRHCPWCPKTSKTFIVYKQNLFFRCLKCRNSNGN